MTRLPTTIACAAALLVLGACGGDAPSRAAATSTAETAPAASTAATEGAPAAARAAPSLSSLGVLGAPTGSAPASRPRAVVLILHGGGWAASTDRTLRAASTGTDGYRSGGFATLTVRMRAGRGAIDSAATAYDAARRRYGAQTPICAIGVSTGGHVALMLAIARPGLACVVANAAPTDLPLWAREVPAARGQIDGYFGTQQARYSPAERPGDVRARVLLQYASNDRDVPAEQGRAFQRARPRGTQLVVLRPGSEPFAHSDVDARQSARLYPRQERLLRSAARAAGR